MSPFGLACTHTLFSNCFAGTSGTVIFPSLFLSSFSNISTAWAIRSSLRDASRALTPWGILSLFFGVSVTKASVFDFIAFFFWKLYCQISSSSQVKIMSPLRLACTHALFLNCFSGTSGTVIFPSLFLSSFSNISTACVIRSSLRDASRALTPRGMSSTLTSEGGCVPSSSVWRAVSGCTRCLKRLKASRLTISIVPCIPLVFTRVPIAVWPSTLRVAEKMASKVPVGFVRWR